ncbi:putative bifunctional diguanylate cyclase/phosphodiesterase [Xylophilus sp.]|uniref:putative bifunctional diguanylate cyclase/phosphodiesterase n=1 Tax=Xylophilus sp. TaxID=2653893 RepID=UPI002D80C346|nr:EAL domain-containing protein [Xylophilus sp.]
MDADPPRRRGGRAADGLPPGLAASLRDIVHLASAIDAHAVVAVLDHRGTFLQVNDRLCRVCGYSRPHIVGRRHGLLHADVLLPASLPQLRRTLAAGGAWHGEVRNRAADGSVFWLRATVVPVAVEGRGRRFLALGTDITAQRQAEQLLARRRVQLDALLQALPDMLFLQDADGAFLLCNPAFAAFIGRASADIVGRTDADLVADAEQVRRFAESDRRALRTGKTVTVEEWLLPADGSDRRLFETIKTPLRDARGRITGLLGVSRDITERKQLELAAERLAFFDALTGLPNRRLLTDRLGHALSTTARDRLHGALCFIDLDNFKDLNDTLGHDMGDRLLAQVAGRLSAAVRESDTVARFGGDEFIVMLELLDDDREQAASQAERVAEELLAALGRPFDIAGQDYYSTPSIGIALFGGGVRDSADDLLKGADLAMYQAKAAGRNTLRFFDPAMQAAVSARSALEADLRQGLQRGELLVHYQPVVDHNARLAGAEALVRWRHPAKGVVSPAQFIPLAEQTGLILPLGQFVLEQACAQLVRWSQQPSTRGLTMAVNVSARQFRHPDFVRQVLGTVQASGANARLLKLELTESMLLGDLEETIAKMGQLKALGVGFSLDDFGTGYSSLSYLKLLPLEQLKIDQSFVRDVLADPNDAAIVRTILALAESLDLQVVAEGVETTGQLSFLRLHGCQGFQGYLFGRPGPVEAMEREHLPAW